MNDTHFKTDVIEPSRVKAPVSPANVDAEQKLSLQLLAAASEHSFQVKTTVQINLEEKQSEQLHE